VALGRKSTGLFSNMDALADELLSAAEAAGERMWRLPLYRDYRSELDSEVADMKNSGGRFGSAILGAIFIERFVSGGIPWAHLDIAGTARAEKDAGDVVKGGTGVGVRTLIAWIEGRGR
jgi:leucyl aminopeptidase